MFHGFLGKNTCIYSSLVVLYFSIPHGVSTFCLCQTWLAEGMKPPEVELNLIWRNKQLWQILASFP